MAQQDVAGTYIYISYHIISYHIISYILYICVLYIYIYIYISHAAQSICVFTHV